MSTVRDNLVLLAAMLTLAGCNGNSWQGLGLFDQLQHPDPAARLSATVCLGDRRDAQCVPYLVDRLTDSEAEVRMYAIMALKRITGQTLGYKYYEPPGQRQQAVRRWRTWLARRNAAPGEARPPAATTTPKPSRRATTRPAKSAPPGRAGGDPE